MEAETRMATPSQIAYIEHLIADKGATIEKAIRELRITEASELIGELLQKANGGQEAKQSIRGNTTTPARKTDFGAGARLGMAFKWVYRN